MERPIAAVDKEHRRVTVETFQPTTFVRRRIRDTDLLAGRWVDLINMAIEAGDIGLLRSLVIADLLQVVPCERWTTVSMAVLSTGASPRA